MHVIETEARRWMDSPGATWETCPRAEWLLYIAQERGVHRHAIVIATCHVVERCLGYIAEDVPLPRQSVEAAYAWTRHEVTAEHVQCLAKETAILAFVLDPPAIDIAIAASNTAFSIDSGNIFAPCRAVRSAAEADHIATGEDLESVRKKHADIVREHLPALTLR